jgi:ABC-2 type transport system permease protein
MNAIRAIVVRDFLVARSYRVALVLDVLLGLLNLLLYYFISRTFTDAAPANLGGAPSYFAFAAVGIAMVTVINAAAVAVAARIREEQLTGTLEATISQPVSVTGLAAGMTGLPFLTAVVRAALYLLLAVILLDLNFPNADWLGVILVLGMSGITLSCLGIASAAMVMVVKRGDVVVGLGVFALGLLSGAFFPISVLPDGLQLVAEVMPPRFSFDGLRSALFDGSHWGNDLLVLALFALTLVPLSLWAFRAAIRFARRAGSIAEY